MYKTAAHNKQRNKEILQCILKWCILKCILRCILKCTTDRSTSRCPFHRWLFWDAQVRSRWSWPPSDCPADSWCSWDDRETSAGSCEYTPFPADKSAPKAYRILPIIWVAFTCGAIESDHFSEIGNRRHQTSPRCCRLVGHSERATYSLCQNMTSSIKLEVHNVSQRRQRTERRPHRAVFTENLMKFGHLFF